MKHGIFKAAAAAVALCVAGWSAAADPEINANADGVMLHGYDPVAYFDDGPTPGDSRWTADYDGGIYHFASKDNQRRFLDDPAAFAPKFGGYCAFGVRMGRKFDIDPTAFHIADDTLYVQLNHATRQRWLADLDENIEIADVIWTEIVETPADAL